MTRALILASLVALIASLVLRLISHARMSRLGLPGEAVYVDDGGEDLLVSDRHGLIGKPDYILRSAGELIPVERKARDAFALRPYEGEILQLAAYCLLVEERYQKPIRRGRIQFLNGSIDVPFDAELRIRLTKALEAIRRANALTDVSRSHNNPAKCRSCGFRHACDQSLI